jgi:hypothetical protein
MTGGDMIVTFVVIVGFFATLAMFVLLLDWAIRDLIYHVRVWRAGHRQGPTLTLVETALDPRDLGPSA